MNAKTVMALSALCMAHAAFAVVSTETKIIAPPVGSNAEWGQLHAANVPLNWVWPAGATAATLTIYANGGTAPVFTRNFTDTTVTSYTWAMGTPSVDAVYDVTLAFDNAVTWSAQLYANVGSFGGVKLLGWDAQGNAKVSNRETVIPYRAAWTNGVAGAATFSVGDTATPLPYSDGYFCLRSNLRGRQLAKLDFETEPASPAFSSYLNISGPGLVIVFY